MNLESERKYLKRYGGQLWVERQGRCTLCGEMITDRSIAHGSLGGVMCKGTKAKRWTYRWAVCAFQIEDGKLFLEYADAFARLESQARKEKRTVTEEIKPEVAR